MKQLIDKSDLIAEIERRIKYDEMVMDHDAQITELLSRELNTLYELSSFIKSLEVKEAENTELLKVRGYLVRDKDDYTAIYAEKPHRGKTEWVNGNGSCLMTINDARLVPDIEFEDEPIEVELTIKEKSYDTRK